MTVIMRLLFSAINFLPHSELIVPQAAQLGIHFFLSQHTESQYTSLRDLIKDTPLLVKESGKRQKEEEERSPATGGFRTHDLQITRRVLFRCATTAAQIFNW